VPVRHFEPAGEGQSLSLLQVDVTPPPPSVPMATHCGTPLVPEPSRQTKLAGQPVVEQSPGWHLLSAPQFPLAQSAGFVHAELFDPGGVPSLSLQR
jgi:hypothetical protein